MTVPEVALISGHRTLARLMRYSHASQEAVRAKLLGERPSLPRVNHIAARTQGLLSA
ncbi:MULTISPECIES: hypothetical protein [unclassified Mesorhizobium]|uniref:hypothetical protein n=1 Tax=unclassified Mesorhizobium TaxID=325217 RepID=UPI0032AF95BD